MKKEKIYNKIIRIIREMYEIQTPVIKDVKEILIKKGYTVNYSGAMSPYSGSYQLSHATGCLLYTSPSPRDRTRSRMPSSA